MRLTPHLIDVSEVPKIFEFDPEVPIEKADVDDNKYEVINDGPEARTAGNTAASVSGFVDAINSGASGVSAAVTLPSQPTSFVVNSTASMNTSTVTISTANSSIPHRYIFFKMYRFSSLCEILGTFLGTIFSTIKRTTFWHN